LSKLLRSTQPIDWQEPTKEAMALLPGVTKNETTIEIVLRDDKLMVLSSSGSDPAQIMQGPDMQFGLFIDDGAGSRRNVDDLYSNQNVMGNFVTFGSAAGYGSVPRALITKIIKE
jgi:hypothetical protein